MFLERKRQSIRRGNARLAAFGWLAALGLMLMLLIIVLTGSPPRPRAADDAADALAGDRDSDVSVDDDPLIMLSRASRALSQRVGRSVVRVEVERSGKAANGELRQLFGGDLEIQEAQGSGVVVSAKSLVVTNYHVVAAADRITVILGDERRGASTVGVDALTDLALLRLDEPADWVPAAWGDSDQVAVGDLVWAVGNPFGLQRSVTFGIVSAVAQDQVASSPFQDFLQTDAAVNPGGSGGPIVNVAGEVVGINTAILGSSFRGISFAVASNTARTVVEQLEADGRVRRGWIGVRLGDVAGSDAPSAPRGAEVLAFSGTATETTPAQIAGIRPGDRVIGWNELPIRDAVQLARLVAQTEVGTTVNVRVLRAGMPLDVELTVADR